MPRIEKVRITGVRYDKMKKHYENTIFDFLNEEDPQHTLLTLVNGGGKGMLLQMIFQALMPLTTWGKNGENHIDALFYNEKQQFEPYTFHVALEWRLDTEPAEWLVTGISVTARKYGQENDEVETEPQYFLYTSKYRKPEDWTIDSLPLYDGTSKQTTSFDDWENWLKKHKPQFQVYSKSKQQAYYQYLSSYGIEKGEWRQMKEINRDEGGIEHYFKKGLDNYGLFHHLIIPEISAYLTEDQEENLIKIFRDSSIIAQKLPKLLKREDAYQLIQGKIVPIKEALEEGQNLETKLQEHQDRANYLYFGMEEQKQTYQYDLDKWMEDQSQTKKKQESYLWQKDNLEYAKEYRAFEQIESEIKDATARSQKLEEVIASLDAEKHNLQVDLAYLDYLESTDKLTAIELRIKALEDAQNLDEEKEQTAVIEQQLEDSWQEIEAEINSDIKRFQTLAYSLKKEIDVHVSQQKMTQNDLNKIRSKLGTYTAYIKTHNQKAIGMEQKYGKDINREPELVLRRVTKELQELEEDFQQLQAEMTLLQESKVKVSTLIGETGVLVKSKKDEIFQVSKKKETRLVEEQSFHKRWCRYYQNDREFSYYTADDWYDVTNKMKNDSTQFRLQYDRIQKEYWYHQLDTSLVNDDYWVANHDVRKIVEKISEMGVQSSYGTQLIQQLSEEERSNMMERYPLLAYGLVIHELDWEKKIDRIELEQLLTHSPVPIFIRERMNQTFSQPFEIIREQGIFMAYKPVQWIAWKGNLAKLTEGYLVDLEKLDGKISEADQLTDMIKTLSSTTFLDILAEEEKSKQQLVELESKSIELYEELSLIEEKSREFNEKTKQNNQQQKLAEGKLNEIGNWIVSFQQFQEYQNLKAEALVKDTELEKRLNKIASVNEELNNSLNSWQGLYHNWLYSVQQQTEQVREILPAISFPDNHILPADGEETPHLRKTIFTGVMPLVNDWHRFKQKIDSANSELASERTKKEYQLKDQLSKKAIFVNLETAWMDWEVPKVPFEILGERLSFKREQIKQNEAELRSVDGDVKVLTGQHKQLEKQIQKLEKQILQNHHLAADPWVNVVLDEKDSEIEESLKKLKEDLDAQVKIIFELRQKQQQLQKQQDILKTHLVSLKKVGEIPISYKEQIKGEPEKLVQHWIRQNNELSLNKDQYHKGFKGHLKELGYLLQDEKIDAPLKQSMNQLIPQLESDSIRSGLSVITSVIEHIQFELQKLKEDKQQAEDAQEIWVDRAVIRVIRIFQSLKQMVNRMKIKNQEGHSFPLVEIERLKEIETTDEEEYRRLLREHFTQTIEKLLENDEAIENLSETQLKKYIDDNQLVLISLRNRYPKLHIYKPQTTNAFLYEKPRKHHYTEWETLNKGSKMEAKGSGGQLLAARTMIMMMIMTFKRQEHSTDWSVLITDNPFGQAVSAHILDPIFSIADVLRFQWIVLAPPELIKLDVSRRFPVYWKLELNQQKQGEIIKEVLQHGGRKFEEFEFSLF
ncbi:hypothetical protein [Pseudoneobacillus rhizosphaerae]|uniref:Uncharacterized protein n=1 Tax=Pseudoneobacillus rhizosphaerae TaxID=2880968 RepID=A0A9C7LCB4_9BACI|nr:hypothetical protein [Pseudoneobacillus rhizosphaerae]CAG9609465.1 hypothetical protein NEOCIP111885_03207 [Pseudoneobacillus rhizosphaerae]